jgi:hypothetical protein
VKNCGSRKISVKLAKTGKHRSCEFRPAFAATVL